MVLVPVSGFLLSCVALIPYPIFIDINFPFGHHRGRRRGSSWLTSDLLVSATFTVCTVLPPLHRINLPPVLVHRPFGVVQVLVQILFERNVAAAAELVAEGNGFSIFQNKASVLVHQLGVCCPRWRCTVRLSAFSKLPLLAEP